MAKIRFEDIRDLKWPEDKFRAREVQEALRNEVVITPFKGKPAYVAGVDAAFLDDKIISVACLFKYPEADIIQEDYIVKKVTFPYIPGLLSFREGPAVIDAIKGLQTKPDIILVDGQGIAHPKGIGIASYIGVLLDIPTIGCAKSRLIGEYKEPGNKRGDWSFLKHEGKTIGAVLRTQDDTRPLFISPGHRTDLKSSIRIVLGCTGKYRLADPVRRADILSKKLKQR